MKERLGPVAGESQPFINPIAGKSCKTCVLTWKHNTKSLFRVHRFRSYSIGDSDMEGSADEQNCPIWKVAWIATYDPWEEKWLASYSSGITLGNDHAHYYVAVERGYCETDEEVYDEMTHIWKSTDDSCFVFIESMRKEDYSDRYPVGFALLRGFGQLGIENNNARPGPPETYFPESATLHRFGFRYPFQIKPRMWEAWDQVLREFNESKPKPSKHTERIVNCAVRLFEAPCSGKGMC